MLCFTYVRGPDFTAGLHFSIRAQVGEFQLGLVCVGISGGNLSWLPGSTRVGTWVPTLPRSLRSTFVSGETVKGTCVSWKRILDRQLGRLWLPTNTVVTSVGLRSRCASTLTAACASRRPRSTVPCITSPCDVPLATYIPLKSSAASKARRCTVKRDYISHTSSSAPVEGSLCPRLLHLGGECGAFILI